MHGDSLLSAPPIIEPRGGTNSVDPSDSISSRFEGVVDQNPHQLAIKSPQSSWTFDDLNRAANRVAHSLRGRLGESPEPVGLLIGDRPRLILAILGTLKAGKFYSPIDMHSPPARIGEIVDHLNTRALICDKETAPLALSLASETRRVFQLEELLMSSDASEMNPHFPVAASDLLGIIYTSGSTGKPKGVIQTHANYLYRISRRAARYQDSGQKAILSSGAAFGSGNYSTFSALLSGKTILPFDLRAQGLGNLKKLVNDEQVTSFSLNPSLFRQFTALMEPGEVLSSVKNMRVSAEPLVRKDLSLFKRHFPPGCVLHHAFSSTETHGIAEITLTHDSEIRDEVIPVGHKANDVTVKLEDETGKAVEVGEIGEFIVTGKYFSPGYWREPELTARKFSQDPISGDTIFRTGDLGRWREDGMLEHHGRADFQVKIHSVRIDMTEVQAVLLNLDSVRDAVVVARPREAAAVERGAEKQLVAYYVPSSVPGPSNGVLRAALLEKLPVSMVPAAFVELDSIPRTNNNKVDRSLLPAPDVTPLRTTSHVDDASEELENQLARIWRRVLGVGQVGLHDNFFDLGGDSLRALRIFAEIQNLTGKQLPIAILFTHPTIEQLAAVLRDNDREQGWSALVPIQPKGARPSLFLAHGGGGEVMVYRDLAMRLGSDQPVYGLQALGLDDTHRPPTTLEEIAGHFVRELRQLQPSGPYFVGGLSAGGVIAFEMAQELVKQGEEVGLLAMFDTSMPGRRRSNRPRKDIDRKRYRLATRLTFHWERWYGMRGRAKLAYVNKKSRIAAARVLKRGVDGDDLEGALLRSYARIEAANRAAFERYVPQVYPGRVTLFRASQQPRAKHNNRSLGWEGLARDGVEVYDVPGYHFSIIVEPRVRVLAEQLTECLERARTALATKGMEV